MESGTPSSESAAIAKRLEALGHLECVSEDYVRFRIELLKAQTAVREALARSGTPPPSKAAGTGESPALRLDDVPFDGALLAKLLEDLVAALARGAGAREDLSGLSAAAAEDPAFLEEFVRRAAFGPDDALLASLAKRFAVSTEALLFLGRVLAAPFVTEAVRRRKKHIGVAAPTGSGCCPYCGSPPGMAKLRREEGRRVLFCSLCGESWEFARVACPFCGSRGSLAMLSVAADDSRWVERCERCKAYLKTTDERKLCENEVLVPLVEATATLYLDMIAVENGCAKGLPYAALG